MSLTKTLEYNKAEKVEKNYHDIFSHMNPVCNSVGWLGYGYYY